MKIIDKVQQEMDLMTKSERVVATHFLNHLNDFALFTLDHIAGDISISTTSVIRFCRRLGFSGFKSFQEALRDEMKHQPTLPAKFHLTAEESLGNGLLAKTIQMGIQCIEKTFSELSPSLLANMVDELIKARRVYVFGMKESYAITHYAWTRLVTARDDAHILEAYNGCVEAIHSLTKEDVCLVFLFHRYTKETVRILSLLKEFGIPVILVTSAPYKKLIPYAKLILLCHVDAHGIKNTSLAPVCLMDYVCNAMILQTGEKGLHRMQELESWIQSSDTLGS